VTLFRNSNANILRAAVRALESTVLPAVQGEAANSAAQLSLALLKVLLCRETTLLPMTQEQIRALEQWSTEIQRLIGPLPSNEIRESDIGLFDGVNYTDLHRRLLTAQSTIQNQLEQLVELRESCGSAPLKQAIDPLLERFAAMDLAATQSYLSEVKRPLGKIESARPVDSGSLQQYLRKRFPERQNLTVADLSGAGFSMSKQILFFTIRDDSGAEEKLVLRQEKPIRWMEGDCTLVRNEFELIRSAYDLGLPVPEPLWCETGAALGPEFMVMRKVAGGQLGEPLKAFQPLSEELVMQIAEILGRLHGAGLAAFRGFFERTGQSAVLDMNMQEATRHRIAFWKNSFARENSVPNPGQVWLFDWLMRNVPDQSRSPVLVHGDFNIHNFLAENGRITSCLDWEWGHAGDPLEDLNNIRPHVEKYSDWDRFCRHYQAHGGSAVEVDPKVLSFNRCLTNAIYSAAASSLSWHVGKGELSDVAAAYGVDIYGYEFHRIALEASLAVRNG
jgi:aminoglycoside phosphotransferase (APT) family kinase protein